jgi:hypothetical protein
MMEDKIDTGEKIAIGILSALDGVIFGGAVMIADAPLWAGFSVFLIIMHITNSRYLVEDKFTRGII